MRNFLWCYLWFITSLALEKSKKECNILLTILVQGFCPLKIKITQFPGGFCFNFFDNLQGIFDQFLTFFIAKM